MKSRYEGKINFVNLDWNSKEGKEAVSESGLKKPPISVLLSPDGKIRDKFEGTISNKEISSKLNKLIKTTASN